MGGISTTKGKVYERAIARELRAAFPSAADVRRTSQADRAGNSDVIATGHPVLERLWLELQDSREPTPLAKLAQAERDIEVTSRTGHVGAMPRMPVVIWHRIRERTSQVTTRLWVLDDLRGVTWRLAENGERLSVRKLWRRLFVDHGGGTVVTLDLTEFVGILRAAIRAAAAEAR